MHKLGVFARPRRRVPTDLEILQEIYHSYYDEFSKFQRGAPDNPRGTKNYVPIDTRVVADALSIEPDIVFGRLYYHLNQMYGYVTEEPSGRVRVPFFELELSTGDRHCIHFPLMASVLADLEDKHHQTERTMRWSFWAVIVSAISATVAIFSLFVGKH